MKPAGLTLKTDADGSGRDKTKLLVRDLRPADFEDIVRYYYRFYDEVKENPLFGIVLAKERPSISEELRWFADLYEGAARGDVFVSVAEVGGHAVGMCEVRTLGRRGSEVSHRGELGIAVSADHRGKGAGSALLRSTLGKCKGKLETVELTVFSKNEGAKRLYERFGFEKYGTRPSAVKRGKAHLDEDLMRLEL